MKLRKPEGEYYLPGEKMSGIRMNICGNCEADIEGCRGIVDYSGECIKLNAGKYILAFRGKGLKMRCMTEYSLIIEGHILAIEYL